MWILERWITSFVIAVCQPSRAGLVKSKHFRFGNEDLS